MERGPRGVSLWVRCTWPWGLMRSQRAVFCLTFEGEPGTFTDGTAAARGEKVPGRVSGGGQWARAIFIHVVSFFSQNALLAS